MQESVQFKVACRVHWPCANLLANHHTAYSRQRHHLRMTQQWFIPSARTPNHAQALSSSQALTCTAVRRALMSMAHPARSFSRYGTREPPGGMNTVFFTFWFWYAMCHTRGCAVFSGARLGMHETTFAPAAKESSASRQASVHRQHKQTSTPYHSKPQS